MAPLPWREPQDTAHTTRQRAPGWRTRHEHVRVVTGQPSQFVDITSEVAHVVTRSGIRDGLVNVQALHTTTAVVVNEHEPLLLNDFASTLERVAPSDQPYRHDDFGSRQVNLTPGERVNGHAHCRALVLAPCACLNVVGGRVHIGRWQRIFLVELDGPRQREVSVMVLGSPEAPPSETRGPRRPGGPAGLARRRVNGEGGR
jgi:secondary thiamine-phosphate synthase enzyme